MNQVVHAWAVLLLGMGLSGCSATPSTQVPAAAGTASPAVNQTVTARPPCVGDQLTIDLGVVGAAAGTMYQQVDFRNASRSGCVLYGYPVVVFLNALGHVVGRAAEPTNVLGTPVSALWLLPGEVGHVSVGVATATNLPAATCRPADTSAIRLTLPGDRIPHVLVSRRVVCSVGTASTLVTQFAPAIPTTAVA